MPLLGIPRRWCRPGPRETALGTHRGPPAERHAPLPLGERIWRAQRDIRVPIGDLRFEDRVVVHAERLSARVQQRHVGVVGTDTCGRTQGDELRNLSSRRREMQRRGERRRSDPAQIRHGHRSRRSVGQPASRRSRRSRRVSAWLQRRVTTMGDSIAPRHLRGLGTGRHGRADDVDRAIRVSGRRPQRRARRQVVP